MAATDSAPAPAPNRFANTVAGQPISPRSAKAIADANLKKAVTKGKEFEVVFLSQMLNIATADIGKDSKFGGGHAEEQWRSFYNQEVAQNVVDRGGIGIAKTITDSLLKAQEAARRQPSPAASPYAQPRSAH